METRKLLAILTILLLSITSLYAQQTQTFIRKYRRDVINKYHGVCQMANGNFVCVGHGISQGTYLIVNIYSPSGTLLKEWRSSSPTGQIPRKVVATPDGGFALVGRKEPSSEFWLMKFNDQADSVWTRTYGVASASYIPNTRSIVTTKDSGFVIAGATLAGVSKLLVVKTNSQGDSIWSYMLPPSLPYLSYQAAHSVFATSDGGYLVTGRRDSSGFGIGVAIKLDSLGQQVWFKNYSLHNYPLYELYGIELASGDYMMATDGDHLGSSYIIQLNAQGDSLKSEYISDTSYHPHNLLQDLIPTSDGNFITTGGSDWPYPSIILNKYNNQLNTIYEKRFFVGRRDLFGTSIIELPNGYAIAGYTDSAALLMIVDSSGTSSNMLIKGSVYAEDIQNCIVDTNDTKLTSGLVKISSAYGDHLLLIDNNGNYQIELYDTGTYTVQWVNNNPFIAPSPCMPYGDTVVFLQNDTIDVSLFTKAEIKCEWLRVGLWNRRPYKRCRSNELDVYYLNEGTDTAHNAVITITLDPNFSLDSASVPNLISLGGNKYQLVVGQLLEGEFGAFKLYLTVDCNSTLSQTLCVEAVISPHDYCFPIDSSWDGSSVAIVSQCTGNWVRFELKNQGLNDMGSSLNYIIVQDSSLYRQGQFQLLAGQSLFEVIPSNGKTYTMIAEQSIGHPGNSHPLKSVEGCGLNSQGTFSLGYISQFPQDDEDKFIDILCDKVVGSYDPNNKTPEPLGLGNNGYINTSQPLDYTIRFQNTGNDTAFLVIIRDTLPPYLDITTLQLTGASHPYTFQILGNNDVLEWTFTNIMLPDSNINELASHGYVGFHINQVAGNVVGTEIRNRAGIYFDFNPPVITNYTLNTLIDNYWDKITVSIDELENNGNSLQLYPNPNNGQFYIELQQPIDGEIYFKVYDLAGKQLLNETYNGAGPHTVAIGGLNTGMYLYQLTSADGVISTGKVLISK